MTVWIESPFDNLPAEGFRKQRYWLMAEAFARGGHTVIYWTGDFNHGTKAKRVLSVDGLNDAHEQGIQTRIIPVQPYRKNISFARIRSHREYAREWERTAATAIRNGELMRPDLVIVALPMIGTASAALRLRKKFCFKLIVDIQDAWPETFLRLAPRGAKWLMKFLLAKHFSATRKAYRDADLVTGVCNRYRAIAARSDFHCAYHGIELSQSAPVDDSPRRNPMRLVYIGNLGNGYDLLTPLTALAEFAKDATLDIAGSGPLEDKWRQQVDRLKLGARVRFHGYLSNDALGQLLAQCSVGIVPMSDDSYVGIPYKLTDYLMANLKVVSSLGGECGELLERHSAGALYRAGEAESFVAALRKCIALPDGGPAQLLKEFDAKHIYDDYVRRAVAL